MEHEIVQKNLMQELDALVIKQRYLYEENEKYILDEVDGLGTLISKFCEWDIDKIILVFLSALEDSNAHEEVEKIEKLFKEE